MWAIEKIYIDKIQNKGQDIYIRSGNESKSKLGQQSRHIYVFEDLKGKVMLHRAKKVYQKFLSLIRNVLQFWPQST